MKKLEKQVITLMNMVTGSGNEDRVREYLKPILVSHCGKDNVWVDSYGNLLAEMKVGTGKGATVTLSSHMDSVSYGYKPGRQIVNKNGILSATTGICGADDKAGLAIVLATLRNVKKIDFDGTIKVAFFVEEEIGCVGSSRGAENESKKWLSESDLAIVIDRRGNRDIVVGNYSQAFCSTNVGKFFEEASAMQDMDWKAVEGGISDATTFAELGVNAVNLSAGYYNEHTSNEYVVLAYMKDTLKLILQALAIVNHHVDTFGEVPMENAWIKPYSYGSYYGYGSSSKKSKYSKYDYMFEDDYEDFYNRGSRYSEKDMALSHTEFGDVEILESEGMLFITQDSGSDVQELILSPKEFEDLAMQYFDNKYGVNMRDSVKAKSTKSSSKSAVASGINEDDLPF